MKKYEVKEVPVEKELDINILTNRGRITDILLQVYECNGVDYLAPELHPIQLQLVKVPTMNEPKIDNYNFNGDYHFAMVSYQKHLNSLSKQPIIVSPELEDEFFGKKFVYENEFVLGKDHNYTDQRKCDFDLCDCPLIAVPLPKEVEDIWQMAYEDAVNDNNSPFEHLGDSDSLRPFLEFMKTNKNYKLTKIKQ